MANSRHLDENEYDHLSNMTHCSICLDEYEDPRTLPCLHTYCKDCIRNIIEQTGPMIRGKQKIVPCPLCKATFTVPDQGVDGLPKNFNVVGLLDLMKSSLRVDVHAVCELCSETIKRNATLFCEKCNKKVCAQCAYNLHRRIKVTSTHKLVDLNAPSQLYNEVPVGPKCEKHAGSGIELFCFECGTNICMACFFESHQSHTCSELNGVADEFRSGLANGIEDTLNQHNRVINEARENKRKLNLSVEESRKAVCDRVEIMRVLLDVEQSSLLENLNSYETTMTNRLDEMVAQMELRMVCAASLTSRAKNTDNFQSVRDLAQAKQELQELNNEMSVFSGLVREAIENLWSNVVSLVHTTLPAGSVIGQIVGCQLEANADVLGAGYPLERDAQAADSPPVINAVTASKLLESNAQAAGHLLVSKDAAANNPLERNAQVAGPAPVSNATAIGAAGPSERNAQAGGHLSGNIVVAIAAARPSENDAQAVVHPIVSNAVDAFNQLVKNAQVAGPLPVSNAVVADRSLESNKNVATNEYRKKPVPVPRKISKISVNQGAVPKTENSDRCQFPLRIAPIPISDGFADILRNTRGSLKKVTRSETDQ